ncbi:hypothetical protein PSH91_14010 [Pseudomonas sp. FP1154]|jgi:hypothetical protein|uniref:Hrp pili protein HrpA n=1 Tax=Pseudomonas rhizophila TaxID=2045200 RepID=A0ABM6UGK2_9PSED|nr:MULTISPECIES: hypothetical protein [Pseudomonas]AVU76711.1 hypothetical protein CRX69_16475 [Pseudomonas rhizophila]MXR30151.1 hypothetical protein [Pseudomonas sp. PICF6]WLG20912.1 hypothetical protein PSH91_14010 [Pseudomonas sp. FP1154]
MPGISSNPFSTITNTLGSAANMGVNAFAGAKQEANSVKANAATQGQLSQAASGGESMSAQLDVMKRNDKEQAGLIKLQGDAALQTMRLNTASAIDSARSDAASKSISNMAGQAKAISY